LTSRRSEKEGEQPFGQKSGGFGDAGKKVRDWLERKKAEGTGGVGGAVVGGVLGGPLGAFVGAQIGTRLVPGMKDALNKLEEAVDELDEGSRSADSKGQERGDAPRQPQPAAGQPRPQPEREAPTPQPSATSQQPRVPPDQVAAAASAASAPDAAGALEPRQAPASRVATPPRREDVLASELSSLKQGAKLKLQQLEEEVAELYAKAEKALAAGDESAARAFLAKRSSTQAKLVELRGGQKRREQEEECESLAKAVDDIYAQAKAALAAGDEAEARRLLSSREEASEALERARQRLREA